MRPTTKRLLFFVMILACYAPSPSLADGSSGAGEATNRSGLGTRTSLGQTQQEETSEAIGHYARARSLIIAAVREFDKGNKIASPTFLLDPVEWRNTLIDRAEDLERVLDPQPRASKKGIKFEADPRLLPEASK